MPKVVKKRLSASKDRGEKILHILNTKKGTADVTEFTNTIKFVCSVLEDFLAAKDKERPKIADEGARIEELLKIYEELLTQLANTQRFLRFFTSNRVRKNLDQINSQLHKEISEIFVKMQATRRQSSKKQKKPMKSEKEIATVTECIKDDEGKVFWEAAFSQNLMVDWNDFIQQLNRVIKVTDEANNQLRYILDNSNTGFISVYKFADFLGGFGPLKQCIEKVEEVLNAEWFHGFLSSVEADRFLEKQMAGTYLIRFSKSKPGSFAIAYVDANNRNAVTHTLIQSCPPSGFKIEEAYNKNARGRLFVTLGQVVDFYSYILKIPFQSDLPRQSWFHGDLSALEAEEILQNHPNGTFLFRFSSKAGFLAVSYVKAGAVKHGVLETVPGGYKFENQPPIYPTLPDVVLNLKDMLQNPLTALTFDVSGVGRSRAFASEPVATEHDPNSNYYPLAAPPPQHQPQNQWQATQPFGGSNRNSNPLPSHNPQPSPLSQSNGYPSNGGQSNGHAANGHSTNGYPGNGYPGLPANSVPKGYQGNSISNQKSVGYGAIDELNIGSPGPHKPMPAPNNAISADYGSMPSQEEEEEMTDPVNYGSMPTVGQQSQSRLPPSNYGVAPIPSASQPNNYGIMPVPGGTISRQSSFGAQQPMRNEYGSMDAVPKPNPISRVGSNSPAPSEYGSMTSLQAPVRSSSPSVSASHAEYGTMPVGRESAKMAIPPQNPQPNGAAQSEYGSMPLSPNRKSVKVPTTPAQNPNSPMGGNYAKIPMGNSGLGGHNPPMGTPTTMQSNYGSIANLQTSQRMVSPVTSPVMSPVTSPQRRTVQSVSSVVTNPESNYGSIANPRLSVKTTPMSGGSAPASPAGPVLNYGKIPTGPGKAPMGPMGPRPGSAPGGPGPQMTYSQIPTPSAKPNPLGNSQGAPGGPMPGNYGVIPHRNTISSKNAERPAPISAQPQYAQIPAVKRSPTVSRPMGFPNGNIAPTGNAPTPSNYGHIPQMNGMKSPPPPRMTPAGIESDYGGLPAEGSLDEGDYGGLPPTEDSQFGESDYGGLPSNQHLDMMAHMSVAESDYGGLPATQQYENHSNGWGDSNSDYGGLPVVR
eukprot:TRINITY_DN1612_c0_g1_i3.p1 TRINITY_DN1612_c0_g1~~TRINITY_DN1612_c0_g1_i3.p1  ORF type:complete len:1090 (-),score=261.69 TRINITY_DN1612_c0_g1_i3:218-3487(-)